MGLISRINRGISNLLHGRQVEGRLDEEVRAYINLVADERIAAGMSPREARRSALVEFGGIEQVKQSVRERRTGAEIELFWHDIRFGFGSCANRLALHGR
jgi:hypothetical protein